MKMSTEEKNLNQIIEAIQPVDETSIQTAQKKW